MPLYEFRCGSCGHEVETLMAFSDPVPTTCEACGGPLKKLLSAPAVQFKGSGFYLTDYGRSGSDSRARDKGEKTESTSTTPTATSTAEGGGGSAPSAPASSSEGSGGATK